MNGSILPSYSTAGHTAIEEIPIAWSARRLELAGLALVYHRGTL